MTKKQNKRGNVRRFRRIMNRLDDTVNKMGMGFPHRIGWGTGVSGNDFGRNNRD